MNDTTTTAEPTAATVTDEVRLALEDDIRQGRLRPGDALDVKAVAERFGFEHRQHLQHPEDLARLQPGDDRAA